MNNQIISFPALLKAARIKLGMSQKDLSDLTGITPTLISKYERGEGNPRAETVSKIAKALNLNVEELLNVQSNDAESKIINIPYFVDFIEKPVLDTNKTMPFPFDFFKYKQINANSLFAVEVKSDSMSPLLNAGDIAIVNASDSEIISGNIYLIVVNQMSFIKKITVNILTGDLTLTSINDDYQPFTVPRNQYDSLEFVGKIVWVGGFM